MIAIIDCDSLIYSAFHPEKELDGHGNPLRTEDGKRFIYKDKTIDQVASSCDFLMNSILSKSKADGYIGFIKGKNTTVNKQVINPLYKSDRGSISPKFWNFCKEYLKLKWGCIEVDNIETDDAVNITRLYFNERK